MRRCAPLFVALAAACATRGPAAPSERARGEVRALEAEYLAERFRRFPEAATRMGWPGANHGAVTDVRPEAVAEGQRFEDAVLARATRSTPGRSRAPPRR